MEDQSLKTERSKAEEPSDAARPRLPARRDVVYAWLSRTQEVVVFRFRGELVACSAICPHMGARMTVDHRTGALVCPWHGLTFELPACRSDHPRYRRLKVYTVTEDDGHVRLD
jgi:nitrite reductase/ring-hydroxylating ferredoxin subunit